MAKTEYECPSPSDCSFTTADISEFTEYINSEHSGEYSKPGWPDNEAGRAAQTSASEEDDEDSESVEE